MSKPAPHKTARVGSLVEIDIPNGLRRDGSQEWRTVRAKVHIVCPNHLVCTLPGDRHGARPYCAETYRLVRW